MTRCSVVSRSLFFCTFFLARSTDAFSIITQQLPTLSHNARSRQCCKEEYRSALRHYSLAVVSTAPPRTSRTGVTTFMLYAWTPTPTRMLGPLICGTDTWGNWAVLTGTATVAQLLGKTTRIGRLLGPPVTAMAISFLLATVGILHPGGTPAAQSLQLLSLQLATPLLLLGSDLRDCASRCGPLLQAFLVASLATIVASVVAWRFCGNFLQRGLGTKDGLIIAAALMAKNIGGGINYVAVCRSLSASPAAVAAGLAVDNLFALLYFPITSALASGQEDVVPVVVVTSSNSESSVSMNVDNDKEKEMDQDMFLKKNHRCPMISVQEASTALSLAVLTTWLGEKLGGTVFAGGAAALPCTTILAVLLASLAPRKFMAGIQPAAHVIGTCCLYLFFATAGAPGIAVADSVRASLVPLGLFLSILYGVHGLLLMGCFVLWGRQQQHDGAFVPQRLLVASSAAIGGPATAAALAQANEWTSLLAPSLLVGNLGYAIATFCGLAYHAIFSH